MIKIYKIENKITKKIYIGQTDRKYIGDRIGKHKYSLKNGKHKNKLMQKDFDLYGFESFEVSVLEELSDYDLANKRERYFIDYFGGSGSEFLYNLETGGRSGFKRLKEYSGMYGKNHSNETKKKISKARKGKPLSKEHAKKISESISGINHPRHKEIKCLNNGKIYFSITQAAAELRLSQSAISRVCRKECKQVRGYIFEYFKNGKEL